MEPFNNFIDTHSMKVMRANAAEEKRELNMSSQIHRVMLVHQNQLLIKVLFGY